MSAEAASSSSASPVDGEGDAANNSSSSGGSNGGSINNNNSSLSMPFAGQLSKFTNVVKGWQPRWFALDPQSGTLEYFLPKSEGLGEKLSSSSSSSSFAHGRGKSRGVQHLAGGVVLPSDEDSQTFNVNLASGEAFKLRATNARERQVREDFKKTPCDFNLCSHIPHMVTGSAL